MRDDDEEDVLERWDRLRQQYEEPKASRSNGLTDAERARVMDAANTAAWNEWCDQRIAAALEHERAVHAEAVGTAIAEMLDQERKAAKDELATEINKLFVVVTELRCALDVLKAERSEHAKVLDMPSPLIRRERVN
jgi:hypothetical protein